jgi:hypothetical protein
MTQIALVPASLSEAIADGAAGEWWTRWRERNPDGCASVPELGLSPEERERSQRARLAILGPENWISGP